MNRIKELRKAAGLSQKELAEIAGCFQTAISKYELGQCKIPSEALIKLCAYFDCSADYLLGLSDQQKTGPRPEGREPDDPLLFTQLQELNDLFLRYTPAQKAQALSFLRFLAARQDNKVDPQD